MPSGHDSSPARTEPVRSGGQPTNWHVAVQLLVGKPFSEPRSQSSPTSTRLLPQRLPHSAAAPVGMCCWHSLSIQRPTLQPSFVERSPQSASASHVSPHESGALGLKYSAQAPCTQAPRVQRLLR